MQRAPTTIPEPDPRERALARTLGLPDLMARVLLARGLDDPDRARAHLRPQLNTLGDPFLFRDMDRAVERIQHAVKAGEPILIHGDYDVDGISGTALLYGFLYGVVPHVFRFLPDRRKDGYGMARRAVDWALDNHVGLFIAVDCGTSDGDLIALLEKGGVDVIVCDHHEFPVDREARGIMLNPVREGERYPFRGLCGAGVAFKLAEALEASGVMGSQPTSDLLDLFALAAVGDLAPLVDENRILVRRGLHSLNHNRRVGIDVLKSMAQVDAPEITAHHIGFAFGPRLNAPGRVANPRPSLEILCSTDRPESVKLATVLESDNNQRRDLTDKVRREVFDMIASMDVADDPGGFVLAGEDWDEGVLGIAAARVADEFGRPALLITKTGELAKGSGRSVPGVHLKEQLDGCREYLVRFGGHAQAVGFTIEPQRIDEFREALSQNLKIATSDLPRKPRLRIDSEVSLSESTLELVDFLGTCEPFGYGNKNPVWKIAGVTVLPQTRTVGSGHLKICVGDESGVGVEGISFNWEQRQIPPEALHRRVIDMAVTVHKGYYLQRVYPEIRVLDIREHKV